MKNYLTYEDIGCKVKTKYGLGILTNIDAGGCYYVKPLNSDEEWERYQFCNDELKKGKVQ